MWLVLRLKGYKGIFVIFNSDMFTCSRFHVRVYGYFGNLIIFGVYYKCPSTM